MIEVEEGTSFSPESTVRLKIVPFREQWEEQSDDWLVVLVFTQCLCALDEVAIMHLSSTAGSLPAVLLYSNSESQQSSVRVEENT